MKIQLCSDIHLEYGDLSSSDFPNIVKPCAPILILAGDVGNPFQEIYKDFLSFCATHFENVLLLSGNHEYYGFNMDKVNHQINNIVEPFPNVVFLNNKIWGFDNIKFIGTILWSHIPDEVPNSELSFINDYHLIKGFHRVLSNLLFEQNVKFIQQSLECDTAQKCIVLTHHAPSYQSISPEYRGNDLNHCFFSDLEYIFQESKNLKCWIHGHTHYNIEYKIDTKPVYCNCYRGPNYKKDCTIFL